METRRIEHMRIEKLLAISAAVSIALFCQTLEAIAQEEPESRLDTLVVSASRHMETTREVTSNITVIDSEALMRSTGSTLQSVLVQQGFQAYNYGGSSYGNAAGSLLYIRGYGQSSMGFSEINAQSLILINGHRINNSFLNIIPLVNIDRVEIIRGPAAVQYGASALGGIVNIITRRGDGALTGSIETGAGSFHKMNGRIEFSGSAGPIDFSMGVSETGYGDYKTGDGITYPHTRVNNSNGFDVDVGYSIFDRHRIGIHFNYGGLTGEVTGYPDRLQMISPNSYSYVDDYAYNSTVSYEGSSVDSNLSWFINYTFARSSRKMKSFMDPNDIYSYPGAVLYPDVSYWSDETVDMDQVQAQLTYDHRYFSLTPGIEYTKYEGSDLTNYSGGLPSRFSFKNSAGYLIAKLRLLEGGLVISAGTRYDRLDESDFEQNYKYSKFTSSFGVSYSPVHFLKVRANFAEGYSLPNEQQIFGDSSYLPNPDLVPQESRTLEFGIDISYVNFDASVTYFMSDFRNKFIAVGTDQRKPTTGFWSRFENLEGAEQDGLELSLRYDLARSLGQDFSLSPYLNITWMTKRKNKDGTAGTTYVTIDPFALPYTPDLLASYGISFDHPGVGLTANVNASYFGKSYVRDWYDPDYVAGNISSAPWFEHGGFTVVDLSFTQRIIDFGNRGRLDFKGQIGNVFDIAEGYAKDVTIPGRSFYAGIVYNF
jgi:vitamin B12 transporter